MKIDFAKGAGLVPAIVQDDSSGRVLMLGYMNEEAYEKTRAEGRVTFFSRSKQRLWTKGENSGNFLQLVELLPDCDADALLVKAVPHGPTCHTGQDTCFDEVNGPSVSFLTVLEELIHARKQADPKESYTAQLFAEGVKKIAQKVGEEATEVVIEAVADNRDKMKEESADLLYHLLVLLAEKELKLADIVAVLESRHRQ